MAVNRSKLGKRSRLKGRAFQAEVAKRWRDSGLYPNAASTQGAQVRSKRAIGNTPPDIEGSPYWVECFHGKRPNPIAKLKQAEEEAERASDPRPALAVIRLHGESEPFALLRLETLEKILCE